MRGEFCERSGVTQILKSVRQALNLLELLQRFPSLGVSDVAAQLDISSSTAHRLLATMQDADFVQQTGAGRKYQLGPAMKSSRHSAAINQLVEISAGHMIALRDRAGETVHLAALSGTGTKFIAAFESPHIMRVTSRVGRILPAHTTAAGKLLLSYLSSDELAALYPDGRLDPGTTASLQTLEGLRAELETVRQLGYGRNMAESELGVAALAVPLTTRDGRSTYALTVSGPDLRFNPERKSALSDREDALLDMLRTTALRIEATFPL